MTSVERLIEAYRKAAADARVRGNHKVADAAEKHAAGYAEAWARKKCAS